MSENQKLGRGLSALLGESRAKKTEIISVSGSDQKDMIDSISLNNIIAGIYQPRRIFDDLELEDLANSIKESGIIQPIVVRKAEEDQYEIIAGERRFRAAKLAGLKKIPAIVKKINNHEALELAIVENIQRSDLSLIEEAAGYKRLLEEFSYTQDQVAKKVGKSRSHITNLLRLLNLPQTVRELLDKKVISMGHARAIINSSNPEELAEKIVAGSLSVRNVEDLVRNEKVEQIQNDPLSVKTYIKTESKIRFINNDLLTKLERDLSEMLDMDVKISYNSFKSNGKIMIKFAELEKVQKLVEKLR